MVAPTTAAPEGQRPHWLRPVLLGLAVLVVALVALVVYRSTSRDRGDGTVSTLGTAPPPATSPTGVDPAPAAETPSEELGQTATTSAPPTTATTAATPNEPAPLAGHFVPEVLSTHPHDVTSFTQGLEWHNGHLLESGGGWGTSSLALVDQPTGESLWRIALPDEVFAEGLTVVDDTVLQLTWKGETLFATQLTDEDPLAQPDEAAIEVRTNAYDGEGWGLCHDGERVVMSDGSSTLTFRHPETFEAIGTVEVTLNGNPVEQLNELECIGGQVWANVWKRNTIVVVDPATGTVDATIDASALVPDGYENSTSNVLNGIARHPETGNIWLTGKRWPTLYEVQLIAVP